MLMASPQVRKRRVDYRQTPSTRRQKFVAMTRFFAAAEATELPFETSRHAKSFAKVGHDECRWPLGDPRDLATFKYCGAPLKCVRDETDPPYCAKHMRVAYPRR